MNPLKTDVKIETHDMAVSAGFNKRAYGMVYITQAELQAWLRAEHGIDIEIRKNAKRGYIGIIENAVKDPFLHTSYYDQYEECLEQCLKLALRNLKL